MNRDERIRRLRLGDLQKVVRSRCGYALPDADDGREYLFELLLTISLGDGADRKMHHTIDLWAPWMDADERLELLDRVNRTPSYLRKSKARDIGERLNLTNKQREVLGVRTIAAVDVTDEQMTERRKAKRLAYEERRRRKAGKQPRDVYLAKVASTQPWEQYGLKRRQYYTRKKAGTLPELTAQGDRPIKLSNSSGLPSAVPSRRPKAEAQAHHKQKGVASRAWPLGARALAPVVSLEQRQKTEKGLPRKAVTKKASLKTDVCERLSNAPRRKAG